ncbi:helix-turn-helix domain-containing protein [bacterium]|nr:helix-turn-helix domain-containing protein [bacterium]
MFFISILFFIPFGIFGEAVSFSDFSYFASRSWSSSALPHNNVTAFYRDDAGLLWVGTVEGLSRIDSKSSEFFSSNTNSAILSNKINDLSGCAGKIFVASALGISEISDSGGKIEKLFAWRGVFDIEAFADCTVFATDGKEIFEIKNNKISKLSQKWAFPEGSVTSLFSDASTLYAGFENGEVRSFGVNGFSEDLCRGNSVSVTAGKAAHGMVFAGTAKGEILEIKNGKCVKIAESGTGETVSSLDFQEGTLVFTSGGALFFAENSGVKRCGAQCADSGAVSEVVLDGSFVWLSGSRGLTLFYPGKFMTFGRESGLLNEKVYALLEDASGRIWVGTRGGGLFVYENGNFKYVKDRKGDIGRFVGGLFENENGKILVGTTDGIVEFSPEKPNVFRKMAEAKGTSVNAVSALFRDRKSRLWAGGNGGSVYLYTKKGWHLIRKFGDDSDFVSAIAEDNSGNLWFAASKGVWRLDENDEFHEINHELASVVPVSLFIGRDETVFVGTMNGGLLLIDRDSKISRVDSHKGLCSDTILGIVSGEDGNLWFSSTKGIFSLPENLVVETARSENGSLECSVFGSADGIRRSESTGGVQPSVLKLKNGDLWFPTLEGVAVLKKEGRKAVKFDSAAPEKKPVVDNKNEEKSNSYVVWAVLAAMAVGILVFAVKRSGSKTSQSASQPAPLPQGSLEEVSFPSSQSASQPAPLPQGSLEEVSFPSSQSASQPAPLPQGSLTRDSQSQTEESAEDVAELYDANAEVNENVEENELFDPARDDTVEKQKYEGYQLEDEIASVYAAEAKTLMEKEKLYKNPDLTLPMLSKKLKLSANTLSQVLNGYCGQTFYNFVNTYRLEEVISMMRDPEYDDRSVLELLLEAGFKSKSTFNPIFKKYTGKTPSEYRKEIQEKR